MYDVGSDILLAVGYYRMGHYDWFGLTIAFVVVPAIFINIFNTVLYVVDRKEQVSYQKAKQNDPIHPFAQEEMQEKIKCSWYCKILFAVLQVGTLFR